MTSTKLLHDHNYVFPADPWCDSSHESQAYVRAFQLYRQEKGSYESWEKLLGTEEQVSKHTYFSFLSVHGGLPTCSLNCVFACVGAGLPGDGGCVAMVTGSASVQSEGQEDWKDTTVVGSELNYYTNIIKVERDVV